MATRSLWFQGKPSWACLMSEWGGKWGAPSATLPSETPETPKTPSNHLKSPHRTGGRPNPAGRPSPLTATSSHHKNGALCGGQRGGDPGQDPPRAIGSSSASSVMGGSPARLWLSCLLSAAPARSAEPLPNLGCN